MNYIISYTIGAIAWTLCEYILHRLIGHSRSQLGSFTKEHRDHHRQGDYFMPILKKVRISLQVIGALAFGSSLLINLNSGLAFSTSYMWYLAE